MEPFDEILKRAGHGAVPAALADMKGDVMAGLRHHRDARAQRRLLGAIALVALSAGGAGAWVPDRENSALAIAPSLELAPSTLLAPDA
jgi:hypothetical protein